MSPESRAPEAVVARLRPHGRALFWPSLALIAILGATGYFYGSFDEPWQNLGVLAAALLLGILLWLIPVLYWLGRHYTITTRRIVLRSGFFVRVRQELLHSRGYDVSVRKNAMQAMFRSGDVLINTGLDKPIVLRDVPSANLVQAALHDLMELSQNPVAARRQHEQSAAPDETTAWGVR
jgi:uncharacterized membrane protein YdbT with pleckstrin-like domain